jgi:hypothetical protein
MQKTGRNVVHLLARRSTPVSNRLEILRMLGDDDVDVNAFDAVRLSMHTVDVWFFFTFPALVWLHVSRHMT